MLQLVKAGGSTLVDGHLKGAMSIFESGGEGLDSTGAFLERVCAVTIITLLPPHP